MRQVAIVGAKRTPIGAFQGSLASVTAPQLGATAIKSVLETHNVVPEDVDEVIMGNVISANIGQAPARQAALYAGLPNSVECLTINKVCGSGLKSVMLATQAIQVGDANMIVAGGMESMSNIPYYLPAARSGQRLGHGQMIDGILRDGLLNAYDDVHMGVSGELCASEHNYSREAQDAFAKESYTRALNAQEKGLFTNEITPVEIPQRKGDPILVDTDDEPGRGNFEKMVKLRPAFNKDGTITAANASKINDGAAALLLMREGEAERRGMKPMARIIAQASAAHEPEWFTTAPAKAMNKVLKKAGMTLGEIDLFEINEAFSVVTMVAMDELNIPHTKVNVNGGAVSLGHPIGASGARILTTLLHAMEDRDAHFGMASLCIGGGEAAALIVERV
ncbi:MAG: acetyl-CoA C-acyltransferase [Candidatus Marinimicrobia bacterium]|nr:acetyl-CoA C-acyltransferase [Candidatus Neomarinimicrobiota bacterium]MCF7850837.1 acetyl-CoA C-acyltransferase [Candidatus Neomarinimicrobiota bacterium]MCF7905196.1 acetyl-CoA C-acyltransferase [Candidatus Neomarinimicrobiota bacterium]